MKKLLLILCLPILGLFANDDEEDQKIENNFYIAMQTHETYLAGNMFYPYMLGFGYRMYYENNGIDFNITIPATILREDANKYVICDLAYVRKLNNDYYYLAGVTNEGGKDSYFNFYNISAFIGFGKMLQLENHQVYLHLKMNALRYFPYLSLRDEYKSEENPYKKDNFLKYATYNLCAGISF